MTVEELNAMPVSKANLLGLMEREWNKLQTFIGGLSDEQLTQLTDSAGWTIKDHLMHLVSWQEGVRAILTGKSRIEAMQLDQATWEAGWERINDALQQKHRDMPLAEVKAALNRSYEGTVAAINSLETDEDLLRPYRDFAPETSHDDPVISWIAGNTFGHIEEHLPWLQAIVDQQ